jgi:hypothetical protein
MAEQGKLDAWLRRNSTDIAFSNKIGFYWREGRETSIHWDLVRA